MAMPTIVVEFQAPGSSTWNNITSYVQSINTDRGGDRDISEFSAGSCVITLFNRDRQFDPKYSGGYYTSIKPVGLVRYSVNGYLRFYGYINAWSFTYDVEGNSYAIISAHDGLGELAKKTLVEQTPTAEFQGKRIDNVLNSPQVAWSSTLRALEAGSIVHNQLIDGGTNALTYLQQVAGADGGVIFADRSGKITFLDTGSTGATYVQTRTNLITNPSAETNATGYITGTRSTAQTKFRTYSVLAAKPGSQYQVYYSQAGQGNSAQYTLSAWVYVADTNYRNYTIAADLFTSGGASLIATYSKTYTLKGTGWQQIGVTFDGGGSLWTGADSFGVNITAESATSSAFYVDGVMLEQTGAIYDYFDGTTVPAGNSYTTYTSVWNGTADASTSTLTVTTTFTAISQTSFTTTDTTGITFSNVDVVYGTETLANRIVLDWAWRNPATTEPIIVNDVTSQNTYGIQTANITDNLLDTATARLNRATAALTALKDPEYRINSVGINIHALTGTQQNTMAQVDIGSTANVTFTPNKVGSSITPTAYTVIGISESITVDTYEATFYLSTSSSVGRVGVSGGGGLE